MEKKVNITVEENNKVYSLFSTYVSYMSMLQYLSNTENYNTTLYDRKWDEAVKINIQLDEAKKQIERKYKPAGNWDRFEFDFDNNLVVFIKNDT